MSDAIKATSGSLKATNNLSLGYALFTKPKNTIPCTEDDIYSAVTGILAMEGMSKDGISCSSKHQTGPHFTSGPEPKIQVLLEMETIDVYNDDNQECTYDVIQSNAQGKALGKKISTDEERARNRAERKLRTLVFFIGMPTELVRELDKEDIAYVQATIRAAFRSILADVIESQHFAEKAETAHGNKKFKQNLFILIKEGVNVAHLMLNWTKYIPLVGAEQPMKVMMCGPLLRRLELKPCCLRKQCVLNQWEKCDE